MTPNQLKVLNQVVALLLKAEIIEPTDTIAIRTAYGARLYTDLGVEVELP